MVATDFDRLTYPMTTFFDDTSGDNIFGVNGLTFNQTKNQPGGSLMSIIRTKPSVFSPSDQKTTIEFYFPAGVTNSDFMLGARIQDDVYDGDGYWARYLFDGSQKISIYRRDAGVFTLLNAGTIVSLAASTKFRLEIEAVGTSIDAEIFRSSDELSMGTSSTTDATFASGAVGLAQRTKSPIAVFGNWFRETLD